MLFRSIGSSLVLWLAGDAGEARNRGARALRVCSGIDDTSDGRSAVFEVVVVVGDSTKCKRDGERRETR